MEWVKRTAFEVLGESPESPEQEGTDAVSVGTYCVADCPELVYTVSNAVIAELNNKRELVRQYAPSQIHRVPFVRTPEDFFSEYAPQKKNLTPSLPTDKGSLTTYLDYLEGSFPDLSGFFFTRLKFRIPEEARRKHTYILGGSGSGKSELLKVLMYPYIKQKPRQATVILFDPHGDIAEQVGRWKQHRDGDNIIFFDPTLKNGFLPCINPLEMPEGANREQIEKMAECLTAVLKEIVGAESNITANMGTLLKAMIAVLLERPDSTLKDLQRFMDDEQNKDLVEYAIQHSPEGKKDLFTGSFYKKSYSPTKHALYTKLQDLFNSQTFYDLTVGNSTLDVRKIMDSRKTVIFSLSKGKIGEQTSSAFGRFLLALMQGFSFQRQYINESDRIPTHIFIDEFHNFVTPSIEDILAESRKYAVHVTLVQQFFGQKTDTQLRAGIMNNTAVKICGTGEDTSLEKMAKVMTGATKEDLQNCDRGVFYIKVKKQGGTLHRAFYSEHARPIRNTTALLGFKNSMTPKEWQKVKADQINRYYRPLKPSASTSEADMFTPSTDQNRRESEKIPLFGHLKGKSKQRIEQAIQEQKTPEWYAEYIEQQEAEKPTLPKPRESTKRPPVILEHQNPEKTPTTELRTNQNHTPENRADTNTLPPAKKPLILPHTPERRQIKKLLQWEEEAPTVPEVKPESETKPQPQELPPPPTPEQKKPTPNPKPKRKPKLSL